MIIWLNGAFGVGKTQTAFELHSRIPDGFVFDPEHIGFALRKVVPPSMHRDFQEHSVWREFTCQGLWYVAENFSISHLQRGIHSYALSNESWYKYGISACSA